MNPWSWIVAGLAFVASAALTYAFSRPRSRFYLLDHPNDRSLHSRPTPRGGGLAMLIAVVVSTAMVFILDGEIPGEAAWLGAGLVLIGGISYLDDRHALSPMLRIVPHAMAAAILVYGGFAPGGVGFPGDAWSIPAWVMAGASLLYIVWMINLYNFMDGMDGFAGGMAVFGFGTFTVLGWLAGHEVFMAINLIVAAGAAGFLVFNFPPARIFMGDVGSSTLGFLAAAFSLWGAKDGIFPFWIALLVFSPFIVDATATLLRRLWRREKVWQAHKTHYYQRLVQAGWGHRKTVLWEYALMAACAGSAVWAARQAVVVQWSVLSFWAAVYVFLALLVTVVEQRKT